VEVEWGCCGFWNMFMGIDGMEAFGMGWIGSER
jgi:hypothetical protein